MNPYEKIGLRIIICNACEHCQAIDGVSITPICKLGAGRFKDRMDFVRWVQAPASCCPLPNPHWSAVDGVLSPRKKPRTEQKVYKWGGSATQEVLAAIEAFTQTSQRCTRRANRARACASCPGGCYVDGVCSAEIDVPPSRMALLRRMRAEDGECPRGWWIPETTGIVIGPPQVKKPEEELVHARMPACAKCPFFGRPDDKESDYSPDFVCTHESGPHITCPNRFRDWLNSEQASCPTDSWGPSNAQ
jgi:hypothetical protein